MNVIVFDLGGTLMEYTGMPYSWADYYTQGFTAISEKYCPNASRQDIARSAEILKRYNPRVNYREEELSAEFLFMKALEHWRLTVPVTECIGAFFEGMELKPVIYPDALPVLEELKSRGYRVAALTDLPSGMPDELFKKDIPELLEHFDLYVSSQSCGFRKPNSSGLRLIAEHFGVPLTELVFVGDEQKDIACAKNAGVFSVLISRNGSAGNFGQDREIRALSELSCIF